MYCPACGAENPDKARFCGSCSHRLDSLMEPGEPGQDDAGPIIDVENNGEVVSNGLKYGILGASLLIPFIGLVMGIIYLAKGETELAIDSYQAALGALEEGVRNRQLLNIKLEALGAIAAETADVDADAGGGDV